MKLVERLPEGKKVEPGAKTALRHHHQAAVMVSKTRAELVSIKENITGFFLSVIIREVDVVEISGNRCTLSVEFEVGGLYSGLFHVSYSSDRQWHDLSDVCPLVQISTEIG
jgi:hypothetical protein